MNIGQFPSLATVATEVPLNIGTFEGQISLSMHAEYFISSGKTALESNNKVK
jgi:hypothetical protein